MADMELMLEAERRGILPPDTLELLQEARRRGMAPQAIGAGQTPAAQGQFDEMPKTSQGAPVPFDQQPSSFRDRPSTGGTTPAPVNGVPVEPSEFRSSPLTSRLYRGYLTALETPTGIEQLAARGVDYAAGKMGYNPGATEGADADAARLYAERVTAEREAGYGTQTDLAGKKTGPEFDPNRVLAAVASPANLGLVKGAGAVIPQGKAFLPALASEGARGALFASAQPTEGKPADFWQEKGQQAGVGFATGAGMQGVTSTVGPWATEKAQALIKRGVPLTAGETLGGFAKYVEDAATSVPILGMAIRSAQRRSEAGFNRAALDEVLSSIGEKSTAPVGREAIKEASAKISARYNTVVPQMRGEFDQPLQQEIAAIRTTVPAEKQAAFDDAISRNLMGKVNPAGRLDGRDLQAAMADIRDESTGLIKSNGSFHDKTLGRKLAEVNDAVTDMAARHSPAELTQKLKDTNLAFAKMTRFDRAAGSVAAEDGVISASQLSNATHVMDKSARKNAVAKGEARMQAFADDAKSVMRKRVPDSGTAGRGMIGAGIYGAGLGTGVALPMVATDAALAAGYLPPVQAAIRSMAAGGAETRAALAKALKDTAPTANIATLPYQAIQAELTPEQKRREALRRAMMERR